MRKRLGVTQKITIPYHPQISGQVEVVNGGIKQILEKVVDHNCNDWELNTFAYSIS